MEKQILPAIATVLDNYDDDLVDSFVYADYAVDALVGDCLTF